MTEIDAFVLKLHVDCLEFCPKASDFLACGMYQLVDEKTQLKKGAVGFLKVQKVKNSKICFDKTSHPKLIEMSGGVFQLRWFNAGSKLASVTSDGCLLVYDVNCEANSTELLRNVKITDDSLLNLNFNDYSVDGGGGGEGGSINFVTSTNRGRLHVGTVDTGSILSWDAHFSEFGIPSEVWCCAYNPFNVNIIYSGGDDCVWKSWDLRDSSVNPVFVNKNCHKAGVTNVSCSPDRENVVFTGSYDDTLRLWDLRNVRRPLHDIVLGGGVWNIKFNPSNQNEILCSCMYNGWAIVELCFSNGFSVVTSGKLDDSLLYGVDWYPSDTNYFACCTFYDNTMRLFDKNG